MHDGRAMPLKLVSQAETPTYLVENRYVLAGFRHGLSLRGCVVSLLTLHNESFNVWSHIVGCAICAALYRSLPPAAAGSSSDAVLRKQLLVNGILFVCSACAHTFMAHSKRLSRKLYVLDRWAVAANLFVHTAPHHAPHFCAFENGSSARRWAEFLSVALLALAIWVGRQPVYTVADKLRAVVCFGAPVVVSFAAATLELWSAGSAARIWPARGGLALCAFTTILGGVFHASKFPERLRPGRWDVFNSHGLMHMCAVVGTVANFYGIRQLEQ